VVQTFSDLGWNVTSLAFSPDGRRLAVGKLDGAVLLLDVESGRRLAEQTGLGELGQITALSFAADGQQLFLGGYSGAIQVWHLGSGSVLESAGLSGGLSVHQRAVHCLAPGPDGSFLISGGKDKRLIWQQPGPTIGARTLVSFQREVRAIRLISEGRVVMASDGEELVWVDLQTSEVTRRLPLGRSYIHAASISPDGARIACSQGSEIKVWATESNETRTLRGEPSEIQWSVLFTPDGRRLLSGGRGNLYVWDAATGEPSASLSLATILYVQTLAVSRDGSLVAAVPSAAGQTLYVFRLPP
jgi:WD40 repeat protein